MGRRERKSDKKKQVWMSIILSLIMIFSAFGVFLGSFSGSNSASYGKYTFEYRNGQYFTKINGNERAFYYSPQQAELINMTSIVTNTLKEADFITIAFNPQESSNLNILELIRFDLSQGLEGKFVYSGLLAPSSQYPELNMADCTNATLKTPVIVLNVSSNISITNLDSCIYLNGRGTELLLLRDRVLYSYYGVINDQ
jgi:hypothetical protein